LTSKKREGKKKKGKNPKFAKLKEKAEGVSLKLNAGALAATAGWGLSLQKKQTHN